MVRTAEEKIRVGDDEWKSCFRGGKELGRGGVGGGEK